MILSTALSRGLNTAPVVGMGAQRRLVLQVLRLPGSTEQLADGAVLLVGDLAWACTTVA